MFCHLMLYSKPSFDTRLAPIILFVSSLVVDYIIELEAGHNTSHDPASGRNLSTVHFSSDFEKRVMFAMSATNFFTLIYMWLWIFQSTRLVLHELHWDLQVRNVCGVSLSLLSPPLCLSPSLCYFIISLCYFIISLCYFIISLCYFIISLSISLSLCVSLSIT